jgi:hypothetical protein
MIEAGQLYKEVYLAYYFGFYTPKQLALAHASLPW